MANSSQPSPAQYIRARMVVCSCALIQEFFGQKFAFPFAVRYIQGLVWAAGGLRYYSYL
jgi:hypothetical protein